MKAKLIKLRDKCTDRQAKFVELIAQGVLRDVAYYSAGFKPKNKRRAQQAASTLLTQNKRTMAYMDALKANADRKTNISRTMQLNRLNKLYELAVKQENVTAGTSVIREQNEMLGYHRDTAPNPEREQARSRLIESEIAALSRMASTRTAALSASPSCKPVASTVKTKP